VTWYLKSQNSGVGEVSHRRPLLCNRLLKHISVATNIRTTIEEHWSTMELHKSQRHLEPESVPEKHAHRSRGVQNQEWLRWWRPSAIYQIGRPQPELSSTETLQRVPVVASLTKQQVHEDTADWRIIICRLWRVVKVL
jgi:hypothetical protein